MTAENEGVNVIVKRNIDHLRCEVCTEKGTLVARRKKVMGKTRLLLCCIECGGENLPYLGLEITCSDDE